MQDTAGRPLSEAYKYPIGSYVKVLPSAQVDIAGVAWPYLDGQIGQVRQVEITPTQLGTYHIVYAIEFAETFKGGWYCWGNTAPGQGQYISQQHLELDNYGEAGG